MHDSQTTDAQIKFCTDEGRAGPIPAAGGWVIVDKAAGRTSMAITHGIRKSLGGIKAGHAGTLDPLASGVLPIAIGPATSLIPFVMAYPKTYTFSVAWGVRTTTDDVLGDVVDRCEQRPSLDQICHVLGGFVGELSQRPPAYCAAKIQGRPAYDLARHGQDVRLSARTVWIDALALVGHAGEVSTFAVTCGSGTYVRALGRDLAESMGTWGHITALRRTRVGPFVQTGPDPFHDPAHPVLAVARAVPGGYRPKDAHIVGEKARILEALESSSYLWTAHPWGASRQEEHSHPPVLPASAILHGVPACRLDGASIRRLWDGLTVAMPSRFQGFWRALSAWKQAYQRTRAGAQFVSAWDAHPRAWQTWKLFAQDPLQDGILACYDGAGHLVAMAKYQDGYLVPTRCFIGKAI